MLVPSSAETAKTEGAGRRGGALGAPNPVNPPRASAAQGRRAFPSQDQGAAAPRSWNSDSAETRKAAQRHLHD